MPAGLSHTASAISIASLSCSRVMPKRWSMSPMRYVIGDEHGGRTIAKTRNSDAPRTRRRMRDIKAGSAQGQPPLVELPAGRKAERGRGFRCGDLLSADAELREQHAAACARDLNAG